MLGKLVTDKSSMELETCLCTLAILADNGGWVSRLDFDSKMAALRNTKGHVTDGNANVVKEATRTDYNKTKLPRYYGFVALEEREDRKKGLRLTRRGNVARSLIVDRGKEEDLEDRFYIPEENRERFTDLVIDSLLFDSFGKNNDGVESSCTDVEPPKVVVRSVIDLDGASEDEIHYVMYGLQNKEFNSYEEAIDSVARNRTIQDYSYDAKFKELNVSENVRKDCKVIKVLSDICFSILERDGEAATGKQRYRLGRHLTASQKKRLNLLCPIYRPLELFVYCACDKNEAYQWVDNSLLGAAGNDAQVFKCCMGSDERPICASPDDDRFEPGAFERALLEAYRHKEKNIYFVVEGTTEADFIKAMSRYERLFLRLNSLKDEYHGWSKHSIHDAEMYNWMTGQFKGIRKILDNNELRLPANLNIIGVISMDNNAIRRGSIDFDFGRCLVETINGDSSADGGLGTQDTVKEPRVMGGQSLIHNVSVKLPEEPRNLIYFGAPGTGKSRKLNERAKKNFALENVRRVTFYPDYMYSQFVGGYKPFVMCDEKDKPTGEITYTFVPGPFLRTYVQAVQNPSTPYLLIIEEINRANPAAVFGDFFQLLDRDGKGRSVYDLSVPVEMQLYLKWHIPEFHANNQMGLTDEDHVKYDHEERRLFDETTRISIPPNMYIWATMNSADQGVFPMDTAFKRRWDFEYIDINAGAEEVLEDGRKITEIEVPIGLKGTTVYIIWNRLREIINDLLKDLKVNEDKLLGPFFISPNDLNDSFGDVFKDKVLLYLHEDIRKLKRGQLFKDDSATYFELREQFESEGVEIFKDIRLADVAASRQSKDDSEEAVEEPEA